MKLKKLSALGVGLTLLAGCSNSKPAASADNGSEGANNQVVVAIDADMTSMDHEIMTDETSIKFVMMCMSGLVEVGENEKILPALAESWDVSEDGLTYTFHLRDGIRWSNGTPITANDFVYGWRRLADPATASEYNYIISTINVKNAPEVVSGEMAPEELGVEAVDDQTFVVHLSLPCSFLLGMMDFQSFYPLNQEYFESKGNQYALSVDDLLYSGPYVMSEWIPGNSYTFTENPDYWNAGNEDLVDTVTFKFIQDTQSALLEYDAGNIDVVNLSGEQADVYKDREGFTNRVRGYSWRIAFAQTDANPELKNQDLRKALSLSIDRELLVSSVLKDGSIAAEGLIPKQFAYDQNGVDFRETAGKLVDLNVEEAQAAYEKAKEALGGDVTLELLYEDSEASRAVAENIQQMWQTNLPGITITLNSKPKKTRLELMNQNNYQLGLTRWGPDYADPQTFMDLFYSKVPGYNSTYFSDAYDALMTRAESGEDASNFEARWADMVEAERILVAEEYGCIPVYQNGGAMMINPKVKGIVFHTATIDSYRHMTKEA